MKEKDKKIIVLGVTSHLFLQISKMSSYLSQFPKAGLIKNIS